MLVDKNKAMFRDKRTGLVKYSQAKQGSHCLIFNIVSFQYDNIISLNFDNIIPFIIARNTIPKWHFRHYHSHPNK